MNVPIKKTLDKVPGGAMVVPLLLGAVVHTVAPGTGAFFGSFTGALFTGALPLIAAFFLCLGTTIEFKATPYIVKKGGALLGAKIGAAAIIGVVLARVIGEAPIQGGIFAGLSVLAVVAAMNDTNGAMYVTLMQQFGRKKDAAAYSVMSIESGPFLTMLTLGIAGLASFPWQTMLGALLPLVVGAVLGNLDPNVRAWLSPGCPGLIPIIAFG